MKEKISRKPKTSVDVINMQLENLGSGTRWKKAPEDIAEYAPLHGRKVLLVDDQPTVIEEFIPHLTVATADNFSFILTDSNVSVEELAQRIKEKKADIILLDYHISPRFKGTDVARALVKINHRGFVIGFSSDKNSEQNWRVAKVYAIVQKDASEPMESIKSLASITSELDLDTLEDYTEWIKKPNLPLSPTQLESLSDQDSGLAQYQHVPGHGDVDRAEEESALLYQAECVNTIMVYKVPQVSQNKLEIDIAKTKIAREKYLKSKKLPTKSRFYPKGFGITSDSDGLPIFDKTNLI